MRNITVIMSLERAVTVDTGLGNKTTWEHERSIAALLTPASLHAITQAALRGQVATHTAKLPAGLRLGALTHRLRSGVDQFSINQIVATPRGTILELQATRNVLPGMLVYDVPLTALRHEAL